MSGTEIQMIVTGIWQTVYMTLVSTLLGYVIGLPWGIALTVTGNDGLHPNKAVYRVLDIAANILRSVPFLIMLILVMPLTMFIVGRMVESSLCEVDHGVIEAAQSAGATNFQIVTRVLLGEARVSLISGATITVGTVLGYSAMAGTIGGGGLGDIAIRYGYYRYQANILWTTVILLVLLVQLFQFIGTMISVKMDKRHI